MFFIKTLLTIVFLALPVVHCQKDNSPNTTLVVPNYQLCFELLDLNIHNLDYHSRSNAYSNPMGEIHITNPSQLGPSVRTMTVPLQVSPDNNVTNYHYHLGSKLCWLDIYATQVTFDFEIIQFYHVALSARAKLDTGLNGSGLQKTDYHFDKTINITCQYQEYTNVMVSVKYEFDLKLLTKKEYDSLSKGESVIAGSMTESYTNELNVNRLRSVDNVNDNDDASAASGMVFAAIIAAILGFFALIGVLIYFYKMYSRKEYIDVDKQGNQCNDQDKQRLSKLKRISLRDGAKKMKRKIIEQGNKMSSKMRMDEEYNDISSKCDRESETEIENESNENNYYQQNEKDNNNNNNNDNNDESIDVSIITNESHGLP